jgi:hypothetical protein
MLAAKCAGLVMWNLQRDNNIYQLCACAQWKGLSSILLSDSTEVFQIYLSWLLSIVII